MQKSTIFPPSHAFFAIIQIITIITIIAIILRHPPPPPNAQTLFFISKTDRWRERDIERQRERKIETGSNYCWRRSESRNWNERRRRREWREERQEGKSCQRERRTSCYFSKPDPTSTTPHVNSACVCVRECECPACFCEILRDSAWFDDDGCSAVGEVLTKHKNHS